ncbi:MAG: outer membrane protein assembly factor BamA [Verrucomicrobia bacterium]|nr:outer membrane protein assembly factor BamA [Verrucomicrobiota bacterium]
MKKWILFFAFLPSVLFAQVQPYTNLTVGGVEVELHHATAEVAKANAQTVRTNLKTKVGERFSQLDFDEDLKHLAEEYDRVEPTLQTKGDNLFITLNLWPKPMIRAITFEGNRHIKSSKLRNELDVSIDTVFNRAEFASKFNALREFYVKKGYFEAELTYKIIPDPQTNSITIAVQVDEGRSGRVKKISFEGFSRAEEKELLEMIYSKKYSLLTSWLTQKGTYHEEAVEQDRYTVLNYLHNQGYADAAVEIEVIEQKRNGLELLFTAHRGPLYHLGKITFSGNTLLSDEVVEKALGLKAGDPYSPEKLHEASKRVQNLFGAQGYIESAVSYEPLLHPNDRIYDVHFQIFEGEQYRVGLVHIVGNRSTQNRVILHETTCTPGEVFDVRKLEQTEAILRNVGYFENVNVYPVRPPSEDEIGPYYRDIHIEVEEASTGSIGLFGGASSIDSLFGGVELVEKNFNIGGFGNLISRGPRALRGGGEYLRLRVNFGQKERSYTASWTKPFFLDSCWVVGVDLNRTLSNINSDDYTIKNWSVNTRANYPIDRYVNLGFHGRIRYNTTSLSSGFRSSLKEAIGNVARTGLGPVTKVGEEITQSVMNAQEAEKAQARTFKKFPGTSIEAKKLLQEANSSGPVVAWGSSIIYDTVDWCHTNGYHCALEGELAAWPGNFSYLSFAYLNVYYQSLGRLGVLKLRSDNRFIMPIWGQDGDLIPLGERIFLGGETTVRGYRSFTLGPQFGPDEPRGGLSSMLVSGEINKRLLPRVEGFVFVDGGYLSGNSWEVSTFRWTTGFGFRLDIMQGMPLMIGWGFPLNVAEVNKNDVETFFFSFGGRF